MIRFMVLDPAKRKGLQPGDAEFLEIIATHGWHVMYVAPRAESNDDEIWWAYSTGLYFGYKHPEIAVFGLDYENSVNVINLAGDMAKKGKRIKPNREYSDFFEGRKCIFHPVDPSHYREYFGSSLWFYEGDFFPALQCFWSDEKGFYPWDPRCYPECRQSQPLLFTES